LNGFQLIAISSLTGQTVRDLFKGCLDRFFIVGDLDLFGVFGNIQVGLINAAVEDRNI